MAAVSFSEEQLRQLHEEIFEAMLRAGWLLNYTFTTGKGWHLGWTEEGAFRSAALKQISLQYALNNDDRAPIAFDIIARGDTLPDYVRPIKLDPAIARFWQESIDTLKIPRDEDRLIILVGIVITWAPDRDTPVRFVD